MHSKNREPVAGPGTSTRNRSMIAGFAAIAAGLLLIFHHEKVEQVANKILEGWKNMVLDAA